MAGPIRYVLLVLLEVIVTASLYFAISKQIIADLTKSNSQIMFRTS